MKENGRMNWLAQIRQMKNRDIRTIEQSELQELQQDAVEHGLPQEERLKNLLDKVRNPYCYARKKILDYLNPPLIEKPVNQKFSLHQMEHYQKFYENGEYVRAVESTTEQNYNMIDGCANNLPKPRIINGRESVLDKLRIRQMAREKQKSGQMQEQSTDIERNRK